MRCFFFHFARRPSDVSADNGFEAVEVDSVLMPFAMMSVIFCPLVLCSS